MLHSLLSNEASWSVHVSPYQTFWTKGKELIYLLNLRGFEQVILPDRLITIATESIPGT